MTTIKVAIVDDEELARKLLREYLGSCEDVEIIADCANGFEAVKAVTDLKPDLLLLDIQMPRLDGFEVLELVGREVNVIFVTAYDKYALRAFEVHAVDYLLKPFSLDRLREALKRARVRLEGKQPMPRKNSSLRPASPDRTWSGSQFGTGPMFSSFRFRKSITSKPRTIT